MVITLVGRIGQSDTTGKFDRFMWVYVQDMVMENDRHNVVVADARRLGTTVPKSAGLISSLLRWHHNLIR